MTELSELLKQSIEMTKSKSDKPKIDFVVEGPYPVLSKDQAAKQHIAMLERLKTFNEAHDTLEFGSDVRTEWLLLAFQELVRDAWPFMRAVGDQIGGVRQEVCEEWLMVHARIMRKGAVE